MKQILRKTLLVLLGGVMSTAAWADTTIGATAKGWDAEGSYTSAYTISSNKTLTLTFTLTGYSGAWAGYVLSLAKNTVSVPQFGGVNGYVWFRSPDFAWFKTDWNTGAVVSNTNTKGSLTQSEWQAFVKDATTVMAIQRYGTQVFIKTTVTKGDDSYTHYFVTEIGTTKDIKAFLCADAAVITISSGVISDTGAIESTSAIIGAVGNDGDFGASPVTTLEPESVLEMHFTNHSSKTESWNNYGIELNYNGNFADIILGGGRWGTLLVDAEGDPVTIPVTNKQEAFNDFGGDFKNKMHGADVTLTIARNGRVVTITAVNTPSGSGESTPFTLKYTIEPNATAFPNFATENISVNLTTDHSHITYKFPITKVNAEVSKCGWATFSSPYKLDFSDVSGLKAHAVTGNNGTAVTMADVNIAAANNGLLLENTAGAGDDPTFFNIPVTTTGDAYTGANFMVAGTGKAVSQDGSYDRYVLVNDGGAKFKKIISHPATVAANRAYLEFTAGSLSRDILDIDGGDATGINMVNGEGLKINGSEVYYNLQGQRVLYPTKGLYIVNGKKVIIK